MVLGGLDLLLGEAVAPRHRRKARAVLVLLVVATFLVELEEAVEFYDLAVGAQVELAAVDLGEDVHGGALEVGRLHLARHGADPDQLVKLQHLRIERAGQMLGQSCQFGRANRLVRLLGILGLDRVLARHLRYVALAEFLADHLARAVDRLGRHVDTVGTHVRDKADGLAVDLDALVEALRQLHRAVRRKAELARCLLLHCRGGEGRARVTARRLGFHGCHGIGAALQRRLQPLGLRLVLDVEPAELGAIGADEARGEGGAGRRLQRGDQRPVFLPDELLDFEFALADDAQRHRLHAAGRTRAGQLTPQHGREIEADEVVERATGEIGVDQRRVDFPRPAHRLGHGGLGDGVEGDARDLDVLQDLLVLQHLQHVPGDRLALAVGIGRENDAVGALHRLGDGRHALGRLGIDVPDHREIVVGIDRAVLGREVANVAVGGVDLVSLAQILVDRLGLGGRLDDDDVHSKAFPLRPQTAGYGRDSLKRARPILTTRHMVRRVNAATFCQADDLPRLNCP